MKSSSHSPPRSGRGDERRDDLARPSGRQGGGAQGGRALDDGSADSPARRAGADRPRERADRTLADRPQDPNRLGGGLQFPPGVDPADARDPGNQTPGAPPVDNRSGRRSGRG